MHHAQNGHFIQFSENSALEDGRSRADDKLWSNDGQWKFMEVHIIVIRNSLCE